MLDIADLFRDTVTLPVAFGAAHTAAKRPNDSVERITRRLAGATLQREGVVSAMIERIKDLFDANR